ncbi:MAG: hypothetical protein J0L91_02600 [Burkholderiales bacterium]|nr:hypothetical protein [Burkholderiales bacterium]
MSTTFASNKYALMDRRFDGRERLIAVYRGPQEANAALALLRQAGSATAHVVIVAAEDPLATSRQFSREFE